MTLASCTVGPDFHAPPEPSLKAYTLDDAVGLPSPTGGESGQHFAVGEKIAQNWWTLFHSASLDDIIREAVANNRTLTAARATLAQSREAVVQARGATYPQLNLDASAARQQVNLSAQGFDAPASAFNLYSLGPRVSFALDPFGQNQRRIEQEAALADVQDFQLSAAWLTLTGNAAAQVVNIAAIRDQIRATGDVIADDERNLQLVKTLMQAGEYTQIDLASADSQLAADRALLPPLRQALNAAQDALSLLLAKAPSEWKPPELGLQDLILPAELPLSMPSQLVHDRPDILSAEAQLHASSAAIGIAAAQLYPNITLSGGLEQQALNTAQLFSSLPSIWSLAGNITAPIFNGGTLQAQKRAAEHAYDAALANYEQTVLQSFIQVADLLYALRHDTELLEEQRRAIDAAETSARLVRATIGQGEIGLLQVLDAERQLQRARLGYIRASAQRYSDTIQLFVAMGGGWREWREMDAKNQTPSATRATVHWP